MADIDLFCSLDSGLILEEYKFSHNKSMIVSVQKRCYHAFCHRLGYRFFLKWSVCPDYVRDSNLQILSLLGILGQGNLVSILFFSEVMDDLKIIGLSLEIHFIDSGDLFSIIASINRDEV